MVADPDLPANSDSATASTVSPIASALRMSTSSQVENPRFVRPTISSGAKVTNAKRRRLDDTNEEPTFKTAPAARKGVKNVTDVDTLESGSASLPERGARVRK